MLRFFSLLITAALNLFCLEASAADIAQRKIFGFSPQGKYFAFEQYGVQDGSGFPYSDIFIIDIKKNTWVKGTPVRTLVHSEETPLVKARSASYKKALPIFQKLQIAERGRILASNPMTQISADPYKVSFSAFATDPPFGPRYELTLSRFKMKAENCDGLNDGTGSGFALHIRKLNIPGASAKLIIRDSAIPKSRGCPLDYAIADVIRFDPGGYSAQNNDTVLAILLYVYSYGFEGRDGRFIAVTATRVTG